jgi:hypothetical protein
MFEIKEKQRVPPDGTRITTFTREVASANAIEVEIGTTGFKGGNADHGSRTYIRIRDLGGTDMYVKTSRRPFSNNTAEFEVFLGGDCELETMLRALKFAVKVLEEELKEVID